MKLSVLIPAYNEERYLSRVAGRVLETPLPAGVDREVIIVDDGSTDRTGEIVRELGRDARIRIFHHPERRGKTAALTTALAHASGEWVLFQDADLEYDPKHYAALIAPLAAGSADMVMGSRWAGKRRGMMCINAAANRVSTATVNALCGGHFTDIFTCHKVFHRQMLEGVKIRSRGFMIDAEIFMKLYRRGARIAEVPVDYCARTDREGKKMCWSGALGMYWALWRYRFWD